MEEAMEVIASAVGSQWAQLYVRLSLDYRGRYKIESAHAEVESSKERCRLRAMDTLARWREKMEGVEEREALRRLLSALARLKDTETLAEQLATANGVTLDDLSYPSDSSPYQSSSEDHSTPRGGQPRRGQLRSSGDESCSLLKSIPESSNKLLLTRQALQHQHSSDHTSSISSIEESTLLQPVNLHLKPHKYAILDVCQRLHSSSFHTICDQLHIPRDSVCEILARETLTEEQYYRALMLWLGRREEQDDEVTFAQLCAALTATNENTALACIKQRLHH